MAKCFCTRQPVGESWMGLVCQLLSQNWSTAAWYVTGLPTQCGGRLVMFAGVCRLYTHGASFVPLGRHLVDTKINMSTTGCLQLWKTWKISGFFHSGKLREIWNILWKFLKIRWYVLVTQSETRNKLSIGWLGDTVTGVGGASHHAA